MTATLTDSAPASRWPRGTRRSSTRPSGSRRPHDQPPPPRAHRRSPRLLRAPLVPPDDRRLRGPAGRHHALPGRPRRHGARASAAGGRDLRPARRAPRAGGRRRPLRPDPLRRLLRALRRVRGNRARRARRAAQRPHSRPARRDRPRHGPGLRKQPDLRRARPLLGPRLHRSDRRHGLDRSGLPPCRRAAGAPGPARRVGADRRARPAARLDRMGLLRRSRLAGAACASQRGREAGRRDRRVGSRS